MAILAIGVLTAILTTKDANWWTLHFSQLGTIGDFSARTFNTTVIVSGSLLAVYGIVIGMTLPATTGRHTRRGLRASLITAGLAMTVVGLIPIPVSVVMHDLAASTLGLSFLSLVAWSLGLPGLPRAFRRVTLGFVIVLATGIIVLTAGFITLALFEFTAFSVVGCWLISLPQALRRHAEVTASIGTESGAEVGTAVEVEVDPVVEAAATHVVPPRRHRRPTLRPARRVAPATTIASHLRPATRRTSTAPGVSTGTTRLAPRAGMTPTCRVSTAHTTHARPVIHRTGSPGRGARPAPHRTRRRMRSAAAPA